MLTDSCDRLCTFADGRTIVLPLTGGYDSRLIALLLSEQGYNNIITYTHDLPSGSPNDIEIAKSIASDLDYDHVTLRHFHADYENFYNSLDWDQFIESVGYLSSIPKISMYITVRKLEEKVQIPDDAIFVPGIHAFGSSLPKHPIIDNDTLSEQEFFRILWNKSYSRWSLSPHCKEQRYDMMFKNRIFHRLPINYYTHGPVISMPRAVRMLELWNWQEHISKYSIDRGLTKYFGYDIYYPLCDRRYFDYLSKINYTERINKRLQKTFVNQLDTDIRGVDRDGSAGSTDMTSAVVWGSIRSAIRRLPNPLYRKTKRVYKEYHLFRSKSNVYDYDPRYAIVSRGTFDKLNLPLTHHKSLLLLILYRDGHFDLTEETDLSRALDDLK